MPKNKLKGTFPVKIYIRHKRSHSTITVILDDDISSCEIPRSEAVKLETHLATFLGDPDAFMDFLELGFQAAMGSCESADAP